MADNELALMAHLLRRAGFGATRDELESYQASGYEATVEELLHPEQALPLEEDVVRRYHLDQNAMVLMESGQTYWLYRMINTRRPLEEKMALFFHGLYATAWSKLSNTKVLVNQVNTFRRYGLGYYRDMLLELSKDPAMIFWLDNQTNHKGAPNENYGREILELFSMGIGTYTEDDVKACARAFTGWTMANVEYMGIRASRDSVWPYGRLDWQFVYLPEDHDDSPKTFLGQKGRLNGDDVIDIICQQSATAWFVASKLYGFFVADTPDEGAIQVLADEFRKSGGHIRSVLRTMFLSDFFRSEKVRLARVKSPAELVAGTALLAGGHEFPERSIVNLTMDLTSMGQELLNPPTVEGWHTGKEWIETGTLVERVNSGALEIGDVNQPGVRAIIQRLRAVGDVLSPQQFVDGCLDGVCQYELAESTRHHLVSHAEEGGNLRFDGTDEVERSAERVGEMLQFIVATREYQLA